VKSSRSKNKREAREEEEEGERPQQPSPRKDRRVIEIQNAAVESNTLSTSMSLLFLVFDTEPVAAII
jgi:hypothetical protein